MNKKIIYVSAPYTNDPEKNVRRALEAADILCELGYIPFIPHLYHYWHSLSPKSYEQWMELGGAFLERCDVILRLDGESVGADEEVEYALALGKPVYYGINNVPRINKE